MRDLLKITKLFRGNKSADSEGLGFGIIVKIVITLIIGGLFFWVLIRAMGRFS